MHKSEKEQVVAELTERLRTSETLIVADYRGLTNAQLEDLRTQLLQSGARFSVVKNTLTRRAAEAAGADALLALLTGPSAIAFVEAEGDPVAVAKALGDLARTSRILAIRGGVLQGRELGAEEIEALSKLPPAEVLRGQVVGAILAPLNAFAGLVNAPLQNLYGLIDARIEQLEAGGDTSAAAAASEAPAEPEADAAAEPAAEPEAEAVASEAETEASEAEADTDAPEAEAQPEPDNDTTTTDDALAAEAAETETEE